MMVDHALDDHLQPNSQSSVVVETVLQLRLLFLALLFGACPILSGDHVSWELLMQLLLHAEQVHRWHVVDPFRILMRCDMFRKIENLHFYLPILSLLPFAWCVQLPSLSAPVVL